MIVRVTTGSKASLTAPATSAYASATLSGSLRTASGALLAGRPMVIQSSSDAAHWTTVKTIVTGAGGTFKTKVTPTRRTLYRAHFSGDDAYAPSLSVTRVVKPRVRLTTPDAPSNAQRGRSFTVSGYLEPRHIAGTSAGRRLLSLPIWSLDAAQDRRRGGLQLSHLHAIQGLSVAAVGGKLADQGAPCGGCMECRHLERRAPRDCAMRRSAHTASRPTTTGHAGLRRGGVTVRERSDCDDVDFPNPLEPYAPLIINVALTGVIPTRAMTPHVPLSPEEIVADAVRCHDVGAAVVHVHARDRGGTAHLRRRRLRRDHQRHPQGAAAADRLARRRAGGGTASSSSGRRSSSSTGTASRTSRASPPARSTSTTARRSTRRRSSRRSPNGCWRAASSRSSRSSSSG